MQVKMPTRERTGWWNSGCGRDCGGTSGGTSGSSGGGEGLGSEAGEFEVLEFVVGEITIALLADKAPSFSSEGMVVSDELGFLLGAFAFESNGEFLGIFSKSLLGQPAVLRSVRGCHVDEDCPLSEARSANTNHPAVGTGI